MLKNLRNGTQRCVVMVLCWLTFTTPWAAEDTNPRASKEVTTNAPAVQDTNDTASALNEADESETNAPVTREEFEELEERLFELEARQTDKPLAQAFDGLELNIGGFLTQSHATAYSQESTSAAFDETNFELLISAKPSQHIDLFAALGWLSATRLDTSQPEKREFTVRQSDNPAIILWGKYHFSEALEVKAGRFVTPWGIIHREHFPPTLFSQQQPQHIQPINGELGRFDTLATFLIGVEASGTFFWNDTSLEYSAYVGEYPGPDDRGLVGESITGGLLGLGFLKNKLKVGLNQQAGKKQLGEAEVHYDVIGSFLKLDFYPFLLKAEAYRNIVGGNNNDQTGYYLQPSVTITSQHILFYRLDHIDRNTDEEEIQEDLSETTVQTIGYNYLPVPNIRFRAEYLLHDFGDSQLTIDTPQEKVVIDDGLEYDYQLLKFSAVLSF